MKKTVILLHTPDSGVGKSTLARHLISLNLVDSCLSFAKDIKHLSLMFHNYLSSNSLDVEDFFQTKKDEFIITSTKSPRDLTCIISDLAQNIYGSNVWAERTYKNISNSFHNTFIIDDWRRNTESDYLESKDDINLIKVYLTIENLEVKNKSKEASSYEGGISSEDCDVVLTYTKDYSNFNEIVKSITDLLKSS